MYIFVPVSTGIFDYTAAIISYCLVGVAVFSGHYDDMSVSAVSAAISKVCTCSYEAAALYKYVCIHVL